MGSDTRLNIVCAHIGDKWGDVWVERLHRMVEANCSVEFDFHVITDHPERFPEWAIPLSREIEWVDNIWTENSPKLMLNRGKPQGCWGKLDAFLPHFSGPVICLDLDIVILRDIANLQRENLSMPWQGDKYNGSVYSFTPSEDTIRLYPDKIPYQQYSRGEQEYVQEAHGSVRPLKTCKSYKKHIVGLGGKQPRTPPPDVDLVYFHGHPTPASPSVQDLRWVQKSWYGLTPEERRSG